MPGKHQLIKYIIAIVVLSWTSGIFYFSCSQEKGKDVVTRKPSGNDSKYELMESQYVGSESCKSCHEVEYKDWKGSNHDMAMMAASDSSVLADFNTTFTSQGVTSKFYMKEGTYFVNTEGPDGRYQDYEIVYTFGVEPLQQYIVEFPDGRFQCLRTAWDTEKNVWFDLYPDMKLVHDEWIHWTNGGLNWNIMCSDCHSTLVKKNYNPVKESYNTTYSIINVSCEACHGPGKEHVEITSSDEYKNGDSTQYIGKLYMGKYTLPKQMVDDCARCHSLRTQFTEYYDHEGSFMDHYAPDWLRDGIYFADGQILGEVYVYASFLQSKMYAQNVKCNDCHNVHSLELKFQGNALCLQCHEPTKYDVKSHHFHEMNTVEAECVSCHMPGRYYMGNDFRNDHSFRVPRPDLSARYGVPNTCNGSGCHDDQSAEWAAQAVREWYGTERVKHFSDALAFGRTREPEAIPGLIDLATDKSMPAIARSSAIMYLGETIDPNAFQAISQLLDDPDPFVRYSSAKSIDRLPPGEKVRLLAPLLVDDVRSVRISALGSMVDIPRNLMSNLDQANYDVVFKEYWKGVQLRSDFPGGQMEIAQYYEKTGNPSLAEQAYIKAIEFDSYYNPARINLAGLYYGQGRFAEAETLFKKIIELEPEFGQAYYSLGLLYAEQNKMLEAAEYLKSATEKIDYNDRVAYNYGLVLQQLGKREEAEVAFKKGLTINPLSESNLYALGYLYFEQNRKGEARKILEQLVKVAPDNQQYLELLNAVRQ
jgi:tetratricopeptide (TPR) repeat protein